MRIAITGTIGSGKSVVSEYLRSKEFYVFDCDKYNAQLIDSNKEVFDVIYKEFNCTYIQLNINSSERCCI